ncbi:MAG: aminoacyl-tRNA hydrolase [Pseudanabaena sp. M135S2SP2A07QC]|nr:aminoacyl-tRNA hydrolase [Pseudanabaena sp. M090S1SP2A07QC]MCA6505582.1 aminoacyl-tRNA hydrolase [Pseudanabaena sp. M172S2SP2A07QC]MCA6517418.1 aminoacyl-tRNA hydrolase [Pseudanabaena sp. M110S1SP2A07QC]MCA6521841.1 aminoacyl-tRNA hydrolase [Pseudanabaena sp. M051S1SP2A07QC]MCA6526190.1 aminoacyl-tRNA hydrolase [Pseudanabaena sp. M179S2SP2A07QC]MCA6531657.1 aminoacyl-tRNA hydrolase [Pseudanabaena sp. M125S2SP2A07QC]MCA6536690.1 aminoacyl-tRNA hydrolase [Pseudanabaena sp. M176S2SP2A07QC]MC
MSLIVGLGNPGAEYERTRHNIGFMAVDRLATSWSISLGKEKRFYGIFGEGRLSPRLASSGKIRLLKPTTYMNVSGQSVRACADWFKGNPENILVIYDDMDLPLGKLRLRPSGSAGGHNGMKSIISHLGTQNFPRLRLGIGRGGKNDIDGAIASKANQNVTSHVLGGFSTTETKILPEIFDLAESTVTSILADGLEKAMSLYNSRSIDI